MARAFTRPETSASWLLRIVTLALLRCDMDSTLREGLWVCQLFFWFMFVCVRYRRAARRIRHKWTDGWMDGHSTWTARADLSTPTARRARSCRRAARRSAAGLQLR